MEELELDFNEGMMLLPITAEHTIDERSPLWGHSHDSLQVPPRGALRPTRRCPASAPSARHMLSIVSKSRWKNPPRAARGGGEALHFLHCEALCPIS